VTDLPGTLTSQRHHKARRYSQAKRCTARYTPAEQLDELVWADLCALLAIPPRSPVRWSGRGVGHGCPPGAPGQADNYPPGPGPAGTATAAAAGRVPRRGSRAGGAGAQAQELDRRRATLATQQRQLDAVAKQRLELRAVADGIQAFCQTVRAGLATATFAQRRLLVELLIDRVVVTDDKVEIRYVVPTSPNGPHPPFCQLRRDHLRPPARPAQADRLYQRGGLGQVSRP
jgi:site-specific DNA recombinase